jgi:hypothetical protein
MTARTWLVRSATIGSVTALTVGVLQDRPSCPDDTPVRGQDAGAAHCPTTWSRESVTCTRPPLALMSKTTLPRVFWPGFRVPEASCGSKPAVSATVLAALFVPIIATARLLEVETVWERIVVHLVEQLVPARKVGTPTPVAEQTADTVPESERHQVVNRAQPGMTRLLWPAIIARAAEIVRSYDTGVTLRQLYYRLVAEGLIPNNVHSYTRLLRLTAEGRRSGSFPPLVDLGRQVDRPRTFRSPADARQWVAEIYRRDRTAGQPYLLYLGVEKATLLGQLRAWFGALGIPQVALRGYSSQTLVDQVTAEVAREVSLDASEAGRPTVLLYCGDRDPSGADILRDFDDRTGCFDQIRRVAVNQDQIEQYGLTRVPAKATDSRGRSTGIVDQVEAEALPPETLQALFADAIADFWDDDEYQAALDQEADDKEALR